MDLNDAFEILEIDINNKSVSKEYIKKQYRKLALKYHRLLYIICNLYYKI